jgi:dihydroflavonol-4-reductase
VHDESSPEPLGVIAGWPYYRAKLFAEQAAQAAGAIILNPSLLLGPGDTEMSSTGSVKLLLDGALPAVPGGGLSFVDVRDVAEAVALALEHGRPGERYLLGAANLTLAEYYARLARIADLPAPRITLPAVGGRLLGWLPLGVKQAIADRFGADTFELEMASHFWYLDSRKAEQELGWTPRDPGETLADTVQDLRARAGPGT